MQDREFKARPTQANPPHTFLNVLCINTFEYAYDSIFRLSVSSGYFML